MEILSLGQTAAASSDIVIDGSGNKLLKLLYDSTINNSSDVRLYVQIMNNNGSFQDLYDIERGKIVLSNKSLCIPLTELGTYRVYRPDISGYSVNLGVDLSDI